MQIVLAFCGSARRSRCAARSPWAAPDSLRFTPSNRMGSCAWTASKRRSPRTIPSSRSEEHTSELQSHSDLVCRLLLEKKKKGFCRLLHVDRQKHRAVCVADAQHARKIVEPQRVVRVVFRRVF